MSTCPSASARRRGCRPCSRGARQTRVDLGLTAARKLGVKVAFIKNEKEDIAKLTGGEEEDRPGLIVFDLNNAGAKPLTLIPNE